MSGKLIGIARVVQKRAPMEETRAAVVSVETGIAGDLRGRKPGRQVTVLFREGWDDACRDLGVFLPWTTRRANLYVEGIDRPRNIGGRISIGGVTLEVTPHINSDGDVQLKIHAESSTVNAGGTVLGGAVFNSDNFRTEVTAKSNQTLLLGGIIQKQSSDIVRKVPILGDIPGLGWAFKKKDKSTQETELMVFLHPSVIHTAQDARELQKEFDKKTPLLQQWRADSTNNPAAK